MKLIRSLPTAPYSASSGRTRDIMDCMLIGGPNEGDLVFQAVVQPSIITLQRAINWPDHGHRIHLQQYLDAGVYTAEGNRVFMWDGPMTEIKS